MGLSGSVSSRTSALPTSRNRLLVLAEKGGFLFSGIEAVSSSLFTHHKLSTVSSRQKRTLPAPPNVCLVLFDLVMVALAAGLVVSDEVLGASLSSLSGKQTMTHFIPN